MNVRYPDGATINTCTDRRRGVPSKIRLDKFVHVVSGRRRAVSTASSRQVSPSSLPSIVSLPQSRSLSSIVLGPWQTALLPLGTNFGDSGSSLSGELMLAKPHFSKESVGRLNPQLFAIRGVMRSV